MNKLNLLLAITCVSILAGCSTVPTPTGSDQYVEGVMALDHGQKDQGVSALLEATRKNPRLIIARSRLGDIYRADGDYSHAAEQYEVVTKLDPYTAKNHYNLGVAYQFLNRLQEAITSYMQALKLDDHDAKSAMNAGLCYMTLGKNDDAVKFTRMATEVNPKLAAAWTNYGAALDAAGQYAKAESAYQRSLELDSKNPITLYNLGSNLIEQHKYRQAIAILEPLLKTQPSAPVQKRLGDAYAGTGRPEDALEQYNASLKRDARYYPALNEMARVLIGQYKSGLELDENQRKAAVQYWKQSLQINPQQKDVVDTVAKYDRATF